MEPKAETVPEQTRIEVHMEGWSEAIRICGVCSQEFSQLNGKYFEENLYLDFDGAEFLSHYSPKNTGERLFV